METGEMPVGKQCKMKKPKLFNPWRMDKLQAYLILGDPTRVLLPACHGSMATSSEQLGKENYSQVLSSATSDVNGFIEERYQRYLLSQNGEIFVGKQVRKYPQGIGIQGKDLRSRSAFRSSFCALK
ncbi:hypothetical protein TorRG33x02_253030 [Trema orientale]|uniref:Uncharacterized protein n=1 Tax=Trema orientale TaxID=63057 RepID=A0A2P5DFY2_TREOI|nr:hypothetical protein TorRG33x02_253030 [Trema orientale]